MEVGETVQDRLKQNFLIQFSNYDSSLFLEGNHMLSKYSSFHIILSSHLHVFLVEALFVLEVVVFGFQEVFQHKDVAVANATGVVRVVNLGHGQPEEPFALQIRALMEMGNTGGSIWLATGLG